MMDLVYKGVRGFRQSPTSMFKKILLLSPPFIHLMIYAIIVTVKNIVHKNRGEGGIQERLD